MLRRYRVCVRFSGHASVAFAGMAIESPASGDYDASLICRDVAFRDSLLEIGMPTPQRVWYSYLRW